MHKTDIQEELYIWKRKIKAFFSSLVYYVCRVFPIDPDKIVMWTFEGQGGYGCSPKYIAKELLRRNREGKTAFKIIWLLEDTEKEFPNEIQKVKNTLWRRAYHLSTAGFWIANTRTFYGTKKRKGTTYLQTWHGTLALKPIGKYRGNQLPQMAYLVSEYDSGMMDYALSGSRWCTDMWPEGLIYKGTILETGTPRCDVFFHGLEEMRVWFRREYHMPDDAKILLYAPTFRGGSQSKNRSVDAEFCSVDFDRLIAALEKRFGGEWYVFLRLHPQLAAQMEHFPVYEDNRRLIDVSQRPDASEIIAASDACLTDYSTVIFESFLCKTPGFIYADDLQEYISDRGHLMFELEEIPFPVAGTNNELEENILTFDLDVYREKTEKFIRKTGIIEDGRASKRVVDMIERLGRSGVNEIKNGC